MQFIFSQSFEKGLAFHTETNGGEAYEIKELDDFVKNSTVEAKNNHLTSCKIAKMYAKINCSSYAILSRFLFRNFIFYILALDSFIIK